LRILAWKTLQKQLEILFFRACGGHFQAIVSMGARSAPEKKTRFTQGNTSFQ